MIKCFIALPADKSVIEPLLKAQDKALEMEPAARAVAKENFHVTLAFIGDLEEVRAKQLAHAVSLMSEIKNQSWTLDRSGCFVKPRVTWVGGLKNRYLEDLAQEAREILDRMDINYDRGVFRAHVTLLRKSRLDAPLLDKPIEWPILKAELFESTLEDGKRVYKPIKY